MIIFSKYNCVKIIELAQLGIIPTSDAIIGPINGIFTINPAIVFSPTVCIIIFIAKLMINI